MSERSRFRDRVFASWYPLVCALSERAGQRELRQRMVAPATGRTLEIGAGSGLNLPHYTESVSELVVSEPSEPMRDKLRELLEHQPPPVGSWELIDAGAEELPFPDASFDTVVSGYVLCTVPDPARALRSLARVLRPGGRYLFLEHVRDADGSALGRIQDTIETPHTWIADGCHPNRRTAELIERSPLEIESLTRDRMPLGPPSVRPIILGSAVMPGPAKVAAG